MPSSCNTREHTRIEPKPDAANKGTLLWPTASPVRLCLPSATVRRMLIGLAMGATIIAIVVSPWGKQPGAHFNPAVTFTFYRLRKVALWDAVFHRAAQLLGMSRRSGPDPTAPARYV
jgi:hypothetical protein